MSSSQKAAADRSVRVQLFPHNRLSNKATRQIAAYRMRMKSNATFSDLASAVVARYASENQQLSVDAAEIQCMRDEANCDCSMDEKLDLLEPAEMILAILAKPNASAFKSRVKVAPTPTKAPSNQLKSVPPPSSASKRSEIVSLLSENESEVIPNSQNIPQALTAKPASQQTTQGDSSVESVRLDESSDDEGGHGIATVKAIKQEKLTTGTPAAQTYEFQRRKDSAKPDSSLTTAAKQTKTRQHGAGVEEAVHSATKSTQGRKADPYDVLSDLEDAPTIAEPHKKHNLVPVPKDAKIISIGSSSPSDFEDSDKSYEPESEADSIPPVLNKSIGKRPQGRQYVNGHLTIVNQEDLGRESSQQPPQPIVNSQGKTFLAYQRGVPILSRTDSARQSKLESPRTRQRRVVSDVMKQRKQEEEERRAAEEKAKLVVEKESAIGKPKRLSHSQALSLAKRSMTSLRTYGRPRSISKSVPPEFYEERQYSDEDLGSIIGDGDSAELPLSSPAEHSTKKLTKSARTPRTPAVKTPKDVAHLASVKPMDKLFLGFQEPPPQSSKPMKFGPGYSQQVRDAFSDSEDAETEDHAEAKRSHTTTHAPDLSVQVNEKSVAALPPAFDEWCLNFKTRYRPDGSSEKYPVVADGPWEGLIVGGPRRGQYMEDFEEPDSTLIEEMITTAEPLSDILSDSSDSSDEEEETPDTHDLGTMHDRSDPPIVDPSQNAANKIYDSVEEPSLPLVERVRRPNQAMADKLAEKANKHKLTEQYVLTGKMFATQTAQDADEGRSPTVPTEECESQAKVPTQSSQSTTTTGEIIRQLERAHDAKQPDPNFDAPPSNQELGMLMSSSPPSRKPGEQPRTSFSHDDPVEGDSSSFSSSEPSEGIPARLSEPTTPQRRKRKTSDADLDVTPEFERALSQVETPSTRSRSATRPQERSTGNKSDKSVRFVDGDIVIHIPVMSQEKRAEYSQIPEEHDNCLEDPGASSEKQGDSPLKSFAEINSSNKDAGINSQDSGVLAVDYVLKHSPNWLNNVTELVPQTDVALPNPKPRSIIKSNIDKDLILEADVELGSQHHLVEGKPKSGDKKKSKSKKRKVEEPDEAEDAFLVSEETPQMHKKRRKEKKRASKRKHQKGIDGVDDLEREPEHDDQPSTLTHTTPPSNKSKKQSQGRLDDEVEQVANHEHSTSKPVKKTSKKKKQHRSCEEAEVEAVTADEPLPTIENDSVTGKKSKKHHKEHKDIETKSAMCEEPQLSVEKTWTDKKRRHDQMDDNMAAASSPLAALDDVETARPVKRHKEKHRKNTTTVEQSSDGVGPDNSTADEPKVDSAQSPIVEDPEPAEGLKSSRKQKRLLKDKQKKKQEAQVKKKTQKRVKKEARNQEKDQEAQMMATTGPEQRAKKEAEQEAKKKAKRARRQERRAKRKAISSPRPERSLPEVQSANAWASSPVRPSCSKRKGSDASAASEIPAPFAGAPLPQGASSRTDKRSSWFNGMLPKSNWVFDTEKASSKRQQSYRPPSPPNTSRPSSAGSLV